MRTHRILVTVSLTPSQPKVRLFVDEFQVVTTRRQSRRWVRRARSWPIVTATATTNISSAQRLRPPLSSPTRPSSSSSSSSWCRGCPRLNVKHGHQERSGSGSVRARKFHRCSSKRSEGQSRHLLRSYYSSASQSDDPAPSGRQPVGFGRRSCCRIRRKWRLRASLCPVRIYVQNRGVFGLSISSLLSSGRQKRTALAPSRVRVGSINPNDTNPKKFAPL